MQSTANDDWWGRIMCVCVCVCVCVRERERERELKELVLSARLDDLLRCINLYLKKMDNMFVDFPWLFEVRD